MLSDPRIGGMTEKSEIGGLVSHFLNGEKVIAVLLHPGFQRRPHIVEISFDRAIAHQGELTGMRQQQYWQDSAEGLKIAVNFSI